jgi:fructose-1,6-bisphosphatase/inositol monophosphatase family enzyme
MSVDTAIVQRFVEEIAAEEIVPRFRCLADHEVQAKKGGEIVTAADIASEARLTRLLQDHLPGSHVVGEEGTSERPEVLDLLQGEDPVWLVDPVDGTANFAAGRPTFAVMVALVEKGAIRASWIHEPSLEHTAVAVSGSGAWIGDQRLSAAAAVPLSEMRGTLHAGDYIDQQLRRRIDASRESLGAIPSLRCAGAEYVRLAAGSLNYVLFPDKVLRPACSCSPKRAGWRRPSTGRFMIRRAGTRQGSSWRPTRRAGRRCMRSFSASGPGLKIGVELALFLGLIGV